MASISVLKNTDAFAAAVAASPAIYIVAPAANLRDGSAFRLLPDLGGTALLETAAAMAESASSSADVGGTAVSSFVVGAGSLSRVHLVPLPDESSRMYSPTQSMAITGGLVEAGLGDSGDATVLVVLRSESDKDWASHGPVRGGAADAPWAKHALGPAACGVARALPLFSRKTSAAVPAKISLGFVAAEQSSVLLGGPSVDKYVPIAIDAVRNTARVCETPCEDLGCAKMEAEARAAVAGLPNVSITSIEGDELLSAGLRAYDTHVTTHTLEPKSRP